jgi:hypothetical protein
MTGFGWRRAVGLVMAATVLAGCTISGDSFEVVEPAEPAPPAPGAVGPALVLDVTNASDGDVAVGYEFVDEGSTGNGEGIAAPCERSVTAYGPIGGTYTILVDGGPIHEGRVPEVLAPVLIVTLVIDREGEASVTGSRVSATNPAFGARQVPCS